VRMVETTRELPRGVQLLPGHGELGKLSIHTELCSAEIYLHGAQVTSWQPAGADEVLFLSESSRWEAGKAIRGGIPICFPWFRGKAGSPGAPAHGLVRTRLWSLGTVEPLPDGAVAAEFHTGSDEWQPQPWWKGECSVVYRVEAGKELKLSLAVTNRGKEPFHYEEALHTYFRVGDVQLASVEGLDGVAFLDNMDGNASKQQSGPVRVTKQTDNAYLQTETALTIRDAALQRTLRTEKNNSATTVVWNPWAEGAAALNDLPSGEWKHFLCVEASNILHAAVELAPGETHTMGALLRVGS
jgi:glucose-6-phosphate 1-epimerase